jgi:hypothetical protein
MKTGLQFPQGDASLEAEIQQRMEIILDAAAEDEFAPPASKRRLLEHCSLPADVGAELERIDREVLSTVVDAPAAPEIESQGVRATAEPVGLDPAAGRFDSYRCRTIHINEIDILSQEAVNDNLGQGPASLRRPAVPGHRRKGEVG